MRCHCYFLTTMLSIVLVLKFNILFTFSVIIVLQSEDFRKPSCELVFVKAIFNIIFSDFEYGVIKVL